MPMNLGLGLGLGRQQLLGGTPVVINSVVVDGTAGTITINQTQANGTTATDYYLVDDNPTRTAAQVIAGSAQGGYANGSFTALNGATSGSYSFINVPDGAHYLHIVAVNSGGNSNVVDTAVTFTSTVWAVLSSITGTPSTFSPTVNGQLHYGYNWGAGGGFTVTTAGNVRLLAVGPGGGGGGARYTIGGGGGAGEVYPHDGTPLMVFLNTGTYVVTSGVGGTGSTNTTDQGAGYTAAVSASGPTKLALGAMTIIKADKGGWGATSNTAYAKSDTGVIACAGGWFNGDASEGYPTTWLVGTVSNGGNLSLPNGDYGASTGGGGAGGSAPTVTSSTALIPGGSGVTSSITGTAVIYGKGGEGASQNAKYTAINQYNGPNGINSGDGGSGANSGGAVSKGGNGSNGALFLTTKV